MKEAIPRTFLPETCLHTRKAVDRSTWRAPQPSGEADLLPIPPRVPRVVIIVIAGPAIPPTGIVIPSPTIVVVMMTIPVPVPMVIRPAGTLPALRRPVPALVSLIATTGDICPHLLNGWAFERFEDGAVHLGLRQSLGAGSPTNCQDRSGKEKNLEVFD